MDINLANMDTKGPPFWDWFQSNENQIIERVIAFDDEWLRREMTPRIRSLAPSDIHPPFNWEIGPCNVGGAKWQLALSPVVKQNLVYTKKVIVEAPMISGWVFLWAKPPKMNGPLQLDLIDSSGQTVVVDAENWSYVLFSFSGGSSFDIDIVPDRLVTNDPHMQLRIGHLLIENLLGEELLLEKIGRITLVDPAQIDAATPKTRLRALGEHIRYLELKKGGS